MVIKLGVWSLGKKKKVRQAAVPKLKPKLPSLRDLRICVNHSMTSSPERFNVYVIFMLYRGSSVFSASSPPHHPLVIVCLPDGL